MCLIILALLVGAFILAKKGKLGPPPWVNAGQHGPGGPQGPWQGHCAHHDPGAETAQHAAEGNAFRILAERLATGDITPEEYRERVAVLREQAPSQNPDDLR